MQHPWWFNMKIGVIFIFNLEAGQASFFYD